MKFLMVSISIDLVSINLTKLRIRSEALCEWIIFLFQVEDTW